MLLSLPNPAKSKALQYYVTHREQHPLPPNWTEECLRRLNHVHLENETYFCDLLLPDDNESSAILWVSQKQDHYPKLTDEDALSLIKQLVDDRVPKIIHEMYPERPNCSSQDWFMLQNFSFSYPLNSQSNLNLAEEEMPTPQQVAAYCRFPEGPEADQQAGLVAQRSTTPRTEQVMNPAKLKRLVELAKEGKWTEMFDLLSSCAYRNELRWEYEKILTMERKKHQRKYEELNELALAIQAKKEKFNHSLKELEKQVLSEALGSFLGEARQRLLGIGALSGESGSCRRLVEEVITYSVRRLSEEVTLYDPIKNALYPDKKEWIERDELIEHLVIAEIEFGDLLRNGDIPEWEIEIETPGEIAQFWRRAVAEAAVQEYHNKLRIIR
jgi:hypothetical protein